MRVGIGAEEIESVSLHFHGDCLAADVREVLERSKLCVLVNRTLIAEANLWTLEWEPFSEWWVMKLGFPRAATVKEGDDVVAELKDVSPEPYTLQGDMDITARLIIRGRFNGEQMRWTGITKNGTDHWIAECVS